MKMDEFLKDLETGLITDRDSVKGIVWAMMETRVKYLFPDVLLSNGMTHSQYIAECLEIEDDLADNFTFLDWTTTYKNKKRNLEAWSLLAVLADPHYKMVVQNQSAALRQRPRAAEFDYDSVPGDPDDPPEKRRKLQREFYEVLMSEMEFYSDPFTVISFFFNIRLESYFDYLTSEVYDGIPGFDRGGEEKLVAILAKYLPDEEDIRVGKLLYIAKRCLERVGSGDMGSREFNETMTCIFTELMKRPFEYLAAINERRISE